jgi:cell division cycle 20-like protein 1 (cofactor of APC complex)
MADSTQETSTVLNDSQKRPRQETPSLISPPDTKDPPTDTHKRFRSRLEESTSIMAQIANPSSDAVDPNALSRALHRIERSREITPGSSPSRKRAKVQVGDRFIPQRAGVDFQSNFHTTRDYHESGPATPSKNRVSELNFQRGM